MPLGKYRLKSKGVRKSLDKANSRYNRLCGPVTVTNKATPEAIKEYRRKHGKKKS